MPRNPIAKALRSAHLRPRKIDSVKRYSRKNSMRDEQADACECPQCNDNVISIFQRLAALEGRQERLGPEFEKVLYDNIWNLYVSDEVEPETKKSYKTRLAHMFSRVNPSC